MTVERSVPIISRAVLMSTFSSFGFGPLRTKQVVMLFFGAVPPILVVGINGVGTDSGDFFAGQFLLIISPSSNCPI